MTETIMISDNLIDGIMSVTMTEGPEASLSLGLRRSEQIKKRHLLEELPKDIVILIADRLDTISKIRLRSTSTRFHNVILLDHSLINNCME